MSSQGPLYPSSVTDYGSGGAAGWSLKSGTLSDLEADDGVVFDKHLQTSASLNYLLCTGFGFSLPSTATPTGFLVEFGGYESNVAANWEVNSLHIVHPTGTFSTNDISGSTLLNKGTETTLSFGGATELAGDTWTYSEVNNTSFGVAISFSGDAVPADIFGDFIRLTTYYSLSGGSTFNQTASFFLAA